ncbi:MAG TPA: hypothetical protein PLR37_04125 [Candidatus Accumulibacter phosphatis]|nr:hypothetical protein [Candidatus Accumulibacter phosphatis]
MMIPGSIGGDLDPLGWAKRPRSQCALELLIQGAKDGDARLAEIHAKHLADGVCNDAGALLMRWDGLRWISMVHDRMRYAA